MHRDVHDGTPGLSVDFEHCWGVAWVRSVCTETSDRDTHPYDILFFPNGRSLRYMLTFAGDTATTSQNSPLAASSAYASSPSRGATSSPAPPSASNTPLMYTAARWVDSNGMPFMMPTNGPGVAKCAHPATANRAPTGAEATHAVNGPMASCLSIIRQG